MVTAFIPVRGGSKSIPLKNIKQMRGKPLVCWNIEALENCPEVDQIIVATDSPEIANVVENRNYKKTKVYWRSADNAVDTASTESVMLEFLEASYLPPNSIFMLVQATSPMTQSKHFSSALKQYEEKNYDSMLSCVRNLRFFWNKNGESINYDYKNRPRRQDFEGEYMENGAFYINKVTNILRDKNRLSGKIGIFEMPEYTGFEIDEPSDWLIIENLMSFHNDKAVNKNDIRLFISDIDGTLTDGGMYYSENGDELKKFNTRDGMGFSILKKNGIKTGIITSENRELNNRRAEKLNLDFIIQGKRNIGKLEAVREMCNKLNISLENVAYVGDDVNDIEILTNVGHPACPNDACQEVKLIPGIKILSKKGGEGCVREYINYLISPVNYEQPI